MCAHGSPSITSSWLFSTCCQSMLLWAAYFSSAPWHRRKAVKSLASLPLLSSAAGCCCSWLSCVELEGWEALLLLVAMWPYHFRLCPNESQEEQPCLRVRGLRDGDSDQTRIELNSSIQVLGPTPKIRHVPTPSLSLIIENMRRAHLCMSQIILCMSCFRIKGRRAHRNVRLLLRIQAGARASVASLSCWRI
jgi:hypothetical protein